MMHPIVHRWTAHIQNDEENREFLQLAMIVVGSVVPSSNKVSFQKQVPPAASEDAGAPEMWGLGRASSSERQPRERNFRRYED